MQKDIILMGSSSELAKEFFKIINEIETFKVHTISSKKRSNPDLLVNEYIEDIDSISEYVHTFENPYIVFFNGYLRENRPSYIPSIEEIFDTFKINFLIPSLIAKNVVRKNKNAKFIFISTIAAIKSRKKNYIYGISKSLTEKYIKNSGFNFLILRFGKIKTEMSESHNNPPFTLDKFEAGMLIHKHIESNGIVYPTIGLKVSAMFIKLLPLNILDYIEKNIKK
ncbi:hypothetical protein OA181_02425 [Acidimicrobiaceae bacterium]|nr:hypothetical protein [Acidimicrobiaceae bacterium]